VPLARDPRHSCSLPDGDQQHTREHTVAVLATASVMITVSDGQQQFSLARMPWNDQPNVDLRDNLQPSISALQTCAA